MKDKKTFYIIGIVIGVVAVLIVQHINVLQLQKENINLVDRISERDAQYVELQTSYAEMVDLYGASDAELQRIQSICDNGYKG